MCNSGTHIQIIHLVCYHTVLAYAYSCNRSFIIVTIHAHTCRYIPSLCVSSCAQSVSYYCDVEQVAKLVHLTIPSKLLPMLL